MPTAPPRPSVVRCTRCGWELKPAVRFCSNCGTDTTATADRPESTGTYVPQSSGAIAQNGLVAAALVFLLCAVICYVVWPLVGLPAQAITSLVPAGGCSNVRTGSPEMYVCSAKVALLKMVGPLAVALLVFLFRKPIARWVAQVSQKLPPDWRFGLPALVAAVFFTMSWAAIHAQTAGSSGLVPQKVFPAVVGLFSFLVARFGPNIQQALSGFFDWRDKYPAWLRIAAAIAIPIVVSFVITLQERVTQPAAKEQLVVLIAMSSGYLALAPRQGDITSRLFARHAA